MKLEVSIRGFQEADLSSADQIMRQAFGTFLGLPEPSSFMGDAGYVRSRWRADPSAAFCAELERTLVGSNFASNWGSVGFFGPLTIRPDLWDRGVGARLMESIVGCFERWETNVRPQSEARRPLSEVRVLATVPDRGHVEASGAD